VKKKDTVIKGSTKIVYNTEKPEQIILEFKDEVQEGTSSKKKRISGKGEINSRISCHLFEYLGSFNIPTHLIKQSGTNEMTAKKLEMIPIRIVIWNVATDNLSKRFDFPKNSDLDYPITELYLKNTEGPDTFINEYHAYALHHVVSEEMRTIYRVSSKANALLKSYFKRRNIQLIGFELEFGRYNGKIVLGDEISLNNCCLKDEKDNSVWDAKAANKPGKETEKLYKQWFKRVTGD